MKKIDIIMWFVIFSSSFFYFFANVYGEDNAENPDSIKQEFVKVHPELITLKNYLGETEQLYQDLKNKYIWAKRNRIKPSEEAKKLLSLGFEIHDDQLMDKAFSKLPWGGWSRVWSKKVDNLMKRTESIETSQKDSHKLKVEIKGILTSMIILRSEYEIALDGDKADTDYSVNYVGEGLDRCKKILSASSLFIEEEKFVPDLYVEGIIYDKENPSAVVNGRMVKIGDTIKGVEIVEITENSVRFQYEDKVFIKNLGRGRSVDTDKVKSLSGGEDRNMADKIIYKVIDTEKSEFPLKVMITNSIIVHANVKGDVLKQILEKAVKETATTIANYKQSIKQSVIYAYLSEKTFKIDRGAWVGKAFWLVGTNEIRIDINKDKLESVYQEVSLDQEKFIQTGKDYPGVFGPDGNYRTKRILPFEKQVHAALKREFDLNPEPNQGRFASSEEWMKACELIESKCSKKVEQQFDLDEETVTGIWYKVEDLKH